MHYHYQLGLLKEKSKLVPVILALLLTMGLALFQSIQAKADTSSINFETPTYTTGTIHNQDGWSSAGAAGSGCAVYDHAVVANTYGYTSFGAQSLRMSNAVTSGCFGDQTFSKSLTDEAGETNAQPSTLSGGTRQSRFEAQWDFASTVPGAQQPGLSTVASPDRGDGARMSWVQMQDTPTGLAVNFFDYQDAAPYGTMATPADGCGAGDNFQFTAVATGLDRTVPHTIKITTDFVAGPRNDVVKVYVDGVLVHTGTTWEDYFRWCTESGGGVPNDATANVSRTVDSILFRTGGAAAPATAGNGFLIDNLTTLSGPSPVGPPATKDQCKKDGWKLFDTPRAFKNQGDCVSWVASQGRSDARN